MLVFHPLDSRVSRFVIAFRGHGPHVWPILCERTPFALFLAVAALVPAKYCAPLLAVLVFLPTMAQGRFAAPFLTSFFFSSNILPRMGKNDLSLSSPLKLKVMYPF